MLNISASLHRDLMVMKQRTADVDAKRNQTFGGDYSVEVSNGAELEVHNNA